MEKRCLALAATVVLLAGCEAKLKWQDTTGQNRPDAFQDADARICNAKTVPSPVPDGISQGEWQEIWNNMKACMADKGWKPIAHAN